MAEDFVDFAKEDFTCFGSWVFQNVFRKFRVKENQFIFPKFC